MAMASSPALQQQLVSRVTSASGAGAPARQWLAAPAPVQTQTQALRTERPVALRAPAASRNACARRHTKSLVLAASASEAKVAAETQQVEFVLVKECRFGQAFFVVGSAPALGKWDVMQALPLEWHEGHVWRASTTLTEEEKAGLEFKFVMLGKRGEVEWQPSDNNKVGDARGRDAPCTQRKGLLILHRPWGSEALAALPVYAPNAPSTNGAAANGAAANGAAANGAASNGAATKGGASNGAAASANGSATSKDKKEGAQKEGAQKEGARKGEGEVAKEEKPWGKNVLSQLLRSWGRKTLMDEEKGEKEE